MYFVMVVPLLGSSFFLKESMFMSHFHGIEPLSLWRFLGEKIGLLVVFIKVLKRTYGTFGTAILYKVFPVLHHTKKDTTAKVK